MQTQRQTSHTQAKVIEMDSRNIYQQNGYKDREHYLASLAYQYGVDKYSLDCIADMLGENEDFDALVSSLEDFSHLF